MMPVCVIAPAAVQTETRSKAASLVDRVQRQLIQSPYLAVRRVSVEERQGVLTLSGRVSNFYLKQMAQAAAATVEGVTSIVNRIDVVEPAY
jgi:osmotically-inducible protein OsmY